MTKLIYALAFVLIVHFTINIDNCQSQWQLMSNGLDVTHINSFTANSNYIFAGGRGNADGFTTQTFPIDVREASVYLSSNNGNDWIPTVLADNNHIAALAANGSTIFAGEGWYGRGVFKSTNNGANWTQTALNNKKVNSLVVSGNNIFAGLKRVVSIFPQITEIIGLKHH